jgi:biotin operon repressor
MTVLEALMTGPCSRHELEAVTGHGDRANRAEIRRLRQSGVCIVNGKRGGYRITDDPDEWNAFSAREHRRGISSFWRPTNLMNGQEELC